MAFQKISSILKVFEGHCEKHGRYEVRYIENPKTGKPINADLNCPICRREAEEAWRIEHADEIEAERKRREEEERQAREKKAAEERQRAMELALRQAAIPPEYEHATFETYKPTTPENAEALRQAKLYAENFERVKQTGVGLFLYGKTGTGKSHIACSILKRILPQTDGIYCMAWQIIEAVKGAPIGSDPLKPFMHAGFLVVDEVGVQNGTKFEESILYPLIDMRVTHKKPTIFISNIQPDAKGEYQGMTVRKVVGERIWDRIQHRSVFLRFTGDSYRKRFNSVDDLIGAIK